MATTYYENIQQLYVAYFNRPADKAGLAYWETAVEAANGDTAAVSAAFAGSKEYQDAYADMTNEQIVDAVYHNLFGRAAETAGKAYWADLLDKGMLTIDNVVAQVAAGALTTDKEAFENKVAYAQAFTGALDTDAEIAAYAKGGDANVAAKALIAGITTDATLATALTPATLNSAVADVVATVTPFSLETAVANVLAAQDAKHDVLVDLIADDAVAAELDAAGVDADAATDADVVAAVAASVATAEGGIDGMMAGFSTASHAMQAAMISDAQDANAETLDGAMGDLADAQEAVDKVDGLSDAIALAQATKDSYDAAVTAATLAQNAENAKIADLATLTGKTVTFDDTAHTLDIGTSGNLVTYSATKGYTLVSGATEAKYEGITAAVAAINASFTADAAEVKADTAATDAMTAADILDSADDYALLGAVADTFVFTNLGTDVLPTWAQIQAEQAIFQDKIDALDAKANAANAGDTYADALVDIKAGISAATDTATLKVVTDAAVANGYLTSADVTAINTAFGGAAADAAAAATAVDTHNWAAREDALDTAVGNLLTNEQTTEVSTSGIGALADELIAQQDAVETAQGTIDDLADAVAAYNHAQELDASVSATDAAISAATKVITAEGFAAPVLVEDTITLATSKDDIFLLGQNDSEIRSMGVLGSDSLYVGTDLVYNSADIGSGTGQVSLAKAGNDSVLEFFLKETATGVDVIVETKAFASSEAGTADLITIHLVGVDMANVDVAHGFITAA